MESNPIAFAVERIHFCREFWKVIFALNSRGPGMKLNGLIGRRIVAFGLVLTFSLLNSGIQSAALITDTVEYGNVLPAVISDIQIPSEFGKAEELFQGKSEKTVIILQDAHSIPDAQTSLHRLIEYFQKQYGVNLVAVEGAASELDTQIFRSFPDQKALRKVMNEFSGRGELSGSVAAAIFSQAFSGVRYSGIEDWDTYEQAVSLYLAAIKKEPELLEKWTLLQKSLEAQKKQAYSKELWDVDQALKGFHENHQSLQQVIQILAKIERPKTGTELAAMLEETQAAGVSDSALEMEVKKLSASIEKHLRSLPPDG